jgi:hypothetical protein
LHVNGHGWISVAPAMGLRIASGAILRCGERRSSGDFEGLRV